MFRRFFEDIREDERSEVAEIRRPGRSRDRYAPVADCIPDGDRSTAAAAVLTF
jgi:hypothetical protein